MSIIDLFKVFDLIESGHELDFFLQKDIISFMRAENVTIYYKYYIIQFMYTSGLVNGLVSTSTSSATVPQGTCSLYCL